MKYRSGKPTHKHSEYLIYRHARKNRNKSLRRRGRIPGFSGPAGMQKVIPHEFVAVYRQGVKSTDIFYSCKDVRQKKSSIQNDKMEWDSIFTETDPNLTEFELIEK